MAIYKNKSKPLHELLEMASNDQGATLLIPDLQRPYVWGPASVRLLIDSLIRGWPFGTLLTWKVDAKDPARALARSFWKVVDRTGGAEGEKISPMNPPAPFHMVLDGQQRVQSLLLALGGDSWGFKLQDREWRTDLEQIKAQGPRGKPHWSLGCLCLNLDAFAEKYAAAKRSVLAIDFKEVLDWVIPDLPNGQSNLAGGSGYTSPLPKEGRFIRLSRLWNAAPLAEMIESHVADTLGEELLKEHGFKEEELAKPVGSLLVALGLVKRTPVTYLELQEYSPVHGPRDVYNDAVVNIFTRLNSAGRVLTSEDITFAWLKIGWNTAITQGNSASRCFELLGEKLQADDLSLSTEDLVAAVSVLWAVVFNGGKLLTNNDLLKADVIRSMAGNISENWSLVEEAMEDVSEIVRARGLRYQEHYQSLRAMQFLWACYFAALVWRKDQTSLKETDRDALKKGLRDLLDATVDRWLICSGWAGLWTINSVPKFNQLAAGLATCVEGLHSQPDVMSSVNHLRTFIEGEVNGLVGDAINAGLNTMQAADRRQVRTYYTALWIWNRLNKARWSMARTILREKSRKHVATDVDHVVAHALWQKKLQQVKAEGKLNEEELSEMGSAINQLGNCLLLEKNFNISKSVRTLSDFLGKVYEFKEGKKAIGDWAATMELEPAQMDSADSSMDELQKLFSDRTEKIRLELEKFVRGSLSRVDVGDVADEPSVNKEAYSSQTASVATKPGGRDPAKIALIKSLKEKFWQEPLSEKYACWGKKGRSYSCFLSIAEQGEIYFGVDWDNPYLTVPKNEGYDTDSLKSPEWHDDGEEARWYDFGPTDLADPQESETLIDKVVELLATIKTR